jgi:hypothetical protein
VRRNLQINCCSNCPLSAHATHYRIRIALFKLERSFPLVGFLPANHDHWPQALMIGRIALPTAD